MWSLQWLHCNKTHIFTMWKWSGYTNMYIYIYIQTHTWRLCNETLGAQQRQYIIVNIFPFTLLIVRTYSKHKVHTILPSLNSNQWLMNDISDLIAMIRWSTNIPILIRRETGQLITHSPINIYYMKGYGENRPEKKIHLKLMAAKYQPFCTGLNVQSGSWGLQPTSSRHLSDLQIFILRLTLFKPIQYRTLLYVNIEKKWILKPAFHELLHVNIYHHGIYRKPEHVIFTNEIYIMLIFTKLKIFNIQKHTHGNPIASFIINN